MDTLADYDAWKSRQQQATAAAAGIVLDTINVKPDELAGDLQLAQEYAKTTGRPTPPLPLVQENRSIFQQQIERKRNSSILSSSPMLAEWLRKPDNAALARDDLEGLSWFERFGRNVTEAAKAVPGGAVSSAGTALEGAGQLLTPRNPEDRRPIVDAIARAGKKTPEEISALRTEIFQQGVINPQVAQSVLSDVIAGDMTMEEALTALEPALAPALGAVSEAMQAGGEAVQDTGAGILPAAPGMENSFGRDIGSGLGSLLTIIGVGLVTGGTGAAIFGGAAGAGEASARARKAGQDEDTQTIAALYGVFPGMTDAIPIERLIANPVVKSGLASVLRSIGKQVAMEGGQEAMQAALQNLIAQNLYAPDQSVFDDVARSMQTGGFVGGLVEAGRIALNAFIPGRHRRAQAAADRAPEAAAKLKELATSSTSSVLRNRMPDAFRDFVARATENGPVENVYVPASEWVEYFQSSGVDPFLLADELDGVNADDLRTALATGGDLQIPTATYAAKMAGSDHDAFLMENMRFDPDEMTAREGREFNERAEDAMQEAFEEAERMRQDDEQYRSFEAKIYDEMVSRLRVAGRSTDVATSEAMLYPAFYRVMAERSGMTTEEFLARYPLPQVRGDVPQGMQLKNVDALTRTLAEARAQKAVGVDRRQSLLEFISDYGGIADRGGELKARDAEVIDRGRGKKKLRLARKGVAAGMRDMFGGAGKKFGPDDVALAAIEAGFMADHPVVLAYKEALANGGQVPDIGAALWDAIDAEIGGLRQFSVDQPAPEVGVDADEIERYLSTIGLSLDDSDDAIRSAVEADQAEEVRRYGQGENANLIVQHNLSASNLLHADKMRGLAVPSVAISNVNYPLDNFGEITLLGGPDMVDTRRDSAAKVFDADVYSPRYPTVRYKIAKSAMNKVWKRLGDVSTELGHVLSGELDNGEVERNGLTAFRDSSAVQLEFLRSTGKAVDLPVMAARTDYVTLVPELRDMPVDSYGMSHEPAVKAAVERAIDLQVQRIHAAAPDLPIEEIREGYYFRGDIRRSVIDDINQEKRVLREPGVDRGAARRVLREAVAPHGDEFAAWVEGQFGDVIAGETVQTESASGDWKYLPHTLDNVVKILKKKIRDGEGFNYGVGSIRSTVANQFKSISAIKAARDRLIPSEDMKAVKEEIDAEFMALAERAGDAAGDLGKRMGWLDTFSERLKEMAERGPRAMKQYDGVTDDLVQEAGDFLHKLANLPSEYFEAKIQRAVDISEFKAAVVPVGAKKEVLDVLKYARVPVFEYDASVEGSRAAMMRVAAGQGNLLFQSGDVRGNRGSVQFPLAGVGNGDSVISLFKSADLSTFIHESGHYFLTVMQDLSARGELASAQDFAAVKNWWRSNAGDVAKDAMRVMPDVALTSEDVIAALDTGSTGDLMKDAAVDVGMQEQWARAFEAYLLEGKAPSIELRGAFEKFRAWLISIYKKLAGLNVSPSDELRAVFDRMLATDDEIAKARQSASDAAPVFATAEEMGLSPEDYAAFLKLRDQSIDEAHAKLLAETMAPIKREREKWYREERAKVRDEVELDVSTQRVYRAIEWMGNRRWLGDAQPEAMGDIRLSKDILVDRYGAGVLKTLPRGKQTVYAVEGGLDPDDAAGVFGYGSGDELVKAMEQAPSRKQAIEDQTDRVMFERHGDVLRDGAIEAAALDAVHGDKRAQALAVELKALVEVSGSDRGLTHKEAREIARQTLSRTKVRDAMNANRYLAAERKAGEEAQRLASTVTRTGMWMAAARRRVAVKARAAVRAEDAAAVASVPPQIDRANDTTGRYNENVVKLVEAKRRQLLNHALYSEARRVADEVEAAERLVARLQKKSTRQNLAGRYLEAIDELLFRYDFRRISGRKEDMRGALEAYVEQMKADGRENEISIPDDVLKDVGRTPYKTLSVEHLRGVVDSLKNIAHTARHEKKLTDAQSQRELDEVVGDIIAAFDANVKKRPPSRVATKSELRRGKVRQFLDLVLNAGTILREIDGFADMGATYRNIKAPLDDAMNRLQVRRRNAAMALDDLYAVYSKDERRRMAVRELVPELGYALSKWEKIAVALNTGNEGNYQRLTDKNIRGSMSEDQVEAIVQSLDERDAKFVQSVWDYLETFRADIEAREKRATGIAPKWVEARPVEIAGKVRRGGYYPLRYDPRLSSLARDDAAQDIATSLQAGRFGKAQTRNGHLKERASSSGRAVEIDIAVLHKHVNQVVYDLELSEPVSASWRILQDARVRGQFIDAGKQADFDALEIWLKDVAEGEVKSADWVGQAARRFKSNFTAAKLAFNLGTVAVQITGLSQTMVVVGKKDFLAGLMMMRRPAVVGEVAAKSTFMSDRQTTFNKDIFDLYNDPKLGPTMGRWTEFRNEWLAPLGLWLMTKVQFYAVDVPTWLAGYQQGLRRFGGDEAQAVAHADAIVKRAQASGVFSDRSAIERGSVSQRTRQNDVVRLFTTLGSYMFAKFNVAYERTAKAAKLVQQEGASTRSAVEVMSWTLDMAFLFALEAVLYAAIKGGLPDGEDDDDSWAEFLMRETALSVVSTIPFVRDIGGSLSGFSGGGAYGSMTEEIAKPLKEMAQGDVDRAFVKSVISATGLFTGIPSSQINRAVDAGWREMEGDDVSPVEYVMGRAKK